MATIGVGSPAPEFSLTDEKGRAVKLSNFTGKQPVVLIFYPMDQTPGCTMQLCAARDSDSMYKEAGVAVFGVNGASAESHQRFVGKHNLTTPLLVDKGLATASRYGAVMGLGLIRVINRTVVGISKEGKIVFYQRGIPSTTDILNKVAPASARS